MSHFFKKQYGQNFLKGGKYAQKLVSALNPSSEDTVIEIGPGDGQVTSLLLKVVAQVTAVEIDYSLVPTLIKRFQDSPNFHLVNADVMQIELPDLLTGKEVYKVIGSLPYNISKQIIAKLLHTLPQPQVMSFIVQEEVAQDYTAQAPKATFLSNWVRLFADVRKLESIPASQFHPQPKVNGAILVITPRPDLNHAFIEQMTQLLRVGFSSPRKTLRNNLGNNKQWSKDGLNYVWEALSLSPTVRPAEISIQTWEQIAKLLYNGTDAQSQPAVQN